MLIVSVTPVEIEIVVPKDGNLMPRDKRGWVCGKTTNKVKCTHRNPWSFKICQACGKKKAPRKKGWHDQLRPYEEWVKDFGETCGICGKAPQGRKLDRDTDHRTQTERGLLCWYCNVLLPRRANADWLEKAVAYLRRAEARSSEALGGRTEED